MMSHAVVGTTLWQWYVFDWRRMHRKDRQEVGSIKTEPSHLESFGLGDKLLT